MKLYRKNYGVFGMVEWSTLIPAGGGNIRIDFTNGSISTRGIEPATFSTENLAVQVAIENSPRFINGKIKLISKYEIGEIEKKDEDKDPAKDLKEGGSGSSSGKSEGIPFTDVRNSQQAKDILMGEPYNIPLAELGSKTAIQEKMTELNIVFPNWK